MKKLKHKDKTKKFVNSLEVNEQINNIVNEENKEKMIEELTNIFRKLSNDRKNTHS